MVFASATDRTFSAKMEPLTNKNSPRGTKRGSGQEPRTGAGQMNITEGPQPQSLDRKEWQVTPGPQWEELPGKLAGRCPGQLHPPPPAPQGSDLTSISCCSSHSFPADLGRQREVTRPSQPQPSTTSDTLHSPLLDLTQPQGVSERGKQGPAVQTETSRISRDSGWLV